MVPLDAVAVTVTVGLLMPTIDRIFVAWAAVVAVVASSVVPVRALQRGLADGVLDLQQAGELEHGEHHRHQHRHADGEFDRRCGPPASAQPSGVFMPPSYCISTAGRLSAMS